MEEEQLHSVIKHHKIGKADENKQQGPFVADPEFSKVAMKHVLHGHAILLQHSRGLGTATLHTQPTMAEIRFMFIDPNTGSGYTDNGFRTWFTTLLYSRTGASFTPHFMRNHLVTWLMEATAQSTAHNESVFHKAVAHLLGNSLQEWSRSYNQSSLQVQGQAALSMLPEWRLKITAELRLARQPAEPAVVEPQQVKQLAAEQQEGLEGAGDAPQEPQVAAEVIDEPAPSPSFAACPPTSRWWPRARLW